MNLEEKKYDAFISYRLCELDQYIAVTLHKELEAFRLPKNMVKQLEKKGIHKRKINRVFRDRDELPITNNLANPITNALQNSEYLLVICSKRLQESIWCKTEVETFIKMHGREHVFAVLAEGEPAESFPEALLYQDYEVTDENGESHIERKSIEPLAADVRGSSKKQIRKKIKEEVLRLAAPMFSCGYDDLKQRHREAKIKRTVTLAVTGCAVFGIVGIVSTALALRIHSQSVKLQEQSVKIEEQYQTALTQNAKSMAADALELLQAGDQKGAVHLAYQALTGSEDEPMPYTSEAEYALSQSLHIYENDDRIVPQRLIEQDSAIDFFKLSPDRKSMMVVDIYGTVSVYDPLTGEVRYQTVAGGYHTYMTEQEADFIDNNTIVYPGEQNVILYNFITGEERQVGDDTVYVCKTDANGNRLLLAGYSTLAVYDTTDLAVIAEYTPVGNEMLGNEAELDEAG